MNGAPQEMARALVRWQHAAGPYWPYVCAAPFLALPSRRRAKRRQRPPQPAFLRVLEQARAAERIAVFADLPVSDSLPVTPALQESGFRVVPVIQRWAVPNAVLPCSELVADLAAFAPLHIPAGALRGVVFLLDGDRCGREDGAQCVSPALFDNRYSYPICRFPPPSVLKSDGITAVDWLSPNGIAEDLLPYVEQLAVADLTPLELRIPSVPAA